jgi:hypothetical protein
MSFAYINEAWGLTPDPRRKKRQADESIPDQDRFAFASRIPKERIPTIKVANIDSSKSNAIYDVTPADTTSSFLEYDDFYKSDFQYTSNVTQEAPIQLQVPLPAPTQQQRIAYEEQMPVPAREHFAERSPHQTPAVVREQMYIELLLYIVSGVFMILLLEQFVQLGTKIPR